MGGPVPVLLLLKANLGSCVRTVAFNREGTRLAAGTDDGIFFVWDVESAKEFTRGRAHAGRIDQTFFGPNDTCLITVGWGNGDGQIEFWDVTSGVALREPQTIPRTVETIPVAAISPDGGTLAATSGTNNIQLWNARSGVEIRRIDGQAHLWAIAFSPDGRYLAAGTADYQTVVWEVAAGKTISARKGHEAEVTSIAFCPDGRLVTASNDGTVRVWAGTGESLGAIQLFPRSREQPLMSWEHIAISPDGRHIVTANGNGTIYILRPDSLAK
jgi:WD40 repeat protein